MQFKNRDNIGYRVYFNFELGFTDKDGCDYLLESDYDADTNLYDFENGSLIRLSDTGDADSSDRVSLSSKSMDDLQFLWYRLRNYFEHCRSVSEDSFVSDLSDIEFLDDKGCKNVLDIRNAFIVNWDDSGKYPDSQRVFLFDESMSNFRFMWNRMEGCRCYVCSVVNS